MSGGFGLSHKSNRLKSIRITEQNYQDNQSQNRSSYMIEEEDEFDGQSS